jgi:hypothetical protein
MDIFIDIERSLEENACLPGRSELVSGIIISEDRLKSEAAVTEFEILLEERERDSVGYSCWLVVVYDGFSLMRRNGNFGRNIFVTIVSTGTTGGGITIFT